ncbi:OsmC family protein [Robiginitalea sp. M366]|uniref:OsmC family protein n=1 Tax=Robiginitalea aestuariiviva TaxID=3036903 RepID=UPI00240DC2D3|nr:OsmC family protein [Robiginitalea aestuariiviva]MDG1571589.1 OsmC family protein [Robiginitalea aestuariiviva]
MASTNHITLKWLGNMAFESTNPSGLTFRIDASPDDGGQGEGLRPKALMLSSLAGCSGLDIASMVRKMKLEVDEFRVEVYGDLTESQPQAYEAVRVAFHFTGRDLHRPKLQRAVDLSVEKYCGVIRMFREFATLEFETVFHEA